MQPPMPATELLDDPPSRPTCYRLVLVVALVAVFSLQKFVEVRSVLRVPGLFEIANLGRTKLALGC